MAVVISVLGYACIREKIHPSKVDPKTEIAFDNLNLEISALNAKYPEITQTRGWLMNQEDLQTAILQKIVMYCGDLPSNFLLKISEINEDVAMSENLLEEADSDVSIESIKAMFPEYTNELEVVKVYCDKLELLSTPELKADYTEELVLTIEASAIPEESKELLETSVKVGGNSNAMWKPVED